MSDEKATPLARRLIRQIEATGPIDVATFMTLCLADRRHGYYTGGDPLGAAGDFVTAPEISQIFGELIGAALAACFSMALANDLNKDGTNPESIETEAEVILKNTGAGFNITEITLTTKGRVKGIDQGKFVEAAEKTKENCPVGKALKAVEIKVDAELIGS